MIIWEKKEVLERITQGASCREMIIFLARRADMRRLTDQLNAQKISVIALSRDLNQIRRGAVVDR